MATLKNTIINDTGYLGIPSGSEAQRPNSPEAGYMRFNTDNSVPEIWDGSEWKEIIIASEGIITDGLVMYLDASDSDSYPGSGTTWYDLTDNNHDISLGSTVSFVSNESQGVLNFPENSNGYGRNTSLNLSNSDFTVMTFVRKNANNNDGRTVTAYNNNWLLGHHDDTYGDYYAEGWVNDISSPKSDTTWRMFTGTGNLSSDSYSLYINDTHIVTNSNGSAGPNGWNLNNQYNQYSNCQIANLICYNRVLTESEIIENYNILKTRFGL